MKIRRSLLEETVSVQTYTGEGAYGPVYGDAVSVQANTDVTRRLVRTSEGDEAISEITLFVHPDDEAYFTPESKVTINGHDSKVMTANPRRFRNSVSHIEVICS